VLNLAAFYTFLRARPQLTGIFPAMLRSFQAVFCSRILINLRQTASEMGDPSLLIQNFSMYEPPNQDISLVFRRVGLENDGDSDHEFGGLDFPRT